MTAYSTDDMKGWALDKPDPPAAAAILGRFAALEPAPLPTVGEPDPSVIEIVTRRLTTSYPAHALTRVPSVVAASVLKRRWDASQEPDESATPWPGRQPVAPASRRYSPPQPRAARGDSVLHAYRFSEPSFLIASAPPDAAQRGTWTHEFLQRVDLARPCDLVDLRDQMAAVISSAKLDSEAAEHIDLEAVAWFFASDLGRRLRSAKRVLREWPFVLGVDPTRYDPMAVLPSSHSPPDAPNATIQAPSAPQDIMLVRGMIDCLFDAGEGWEILDYKTDAVTGDQIAARRDEYRGQLSIYRAAVEAAWKTPPGKCWLVFLSPREIVQVGDRMDATGAP